MLAPTLRWTEKTAGSSTAQDHSQANDPASLGMTKLLSYIGTGKLVPFLMRRRLSFGARGELHLPVGDVDGVLDLLAAVLLANLLSFFLDE